MVPIDYTQYSTFLDCTWRWWERYAEGMDLRRDGPRKDNLALGGVVHDMLEGWRRSGSAEPSARVMGMLNPAPATLALAKRLVEGYVETFHDPPWEMERLEEPLRFPLTQVCSVCDGSGIKGYVGGDDDEIEKCWKCNGIGGRLDGLAKLDGYFYLPEDTRVEGGAYAGHTLTLSRGWWSHEYKTKGYGVDRTRWGKEWFAKRQADFQMLALGHHLATSIMYGEAVQGVLVSVLEKPYEHTPQRTCKGCGETLDFDTYRATNGPVIHYVQFEREVDKGWIADVVTQPGLMAYGKTRKAALEAVQALAPELTLVTTKPKDGVGWFGCMLCGHVQELALPEVKPSAEPKYFRMTVTRTPAQLAVAKQEILAVAMRMERMRREGATAETPNRDNCVVGRYGGGCVYEGVHTNGLMAGEDPTFIKVDTLRYMGIGG